MFWCKLLYTFIECLKLWAQASSYLPWRALLHESEGWLVSSPNPPASGSIGVTWVIHHAWWPWKAHCGSVLCWASKGESNACKVHYLERNIKLFPISMSVFLYLLFMCLGSRKKSFSQNLVELVTLIRALWLRYLSKGTIVWLNKGLMVYFDLYAPNWEGKKELIMLFWLIFGNFWCPLVTWITFSSNLSNFERNPKKT